MGRRKRDPRRERRWREIIERQAASGLSVRAFCRREGLGESSYWYWKRELAYRVTEAGKRRTSQPAASGSAASASAASELKGDGGDSPLTRGLGGEQGRATQNGQQRAEATAATPVSPASHGGDGARFVSVGQVLFGQPTVEVRLASGSVVRIEGCDRATLAFVFDVLASPDASSAKAHAGACSAANSVKSSASPRSRSC